MPRSSSPVFTNVLLIGLLGLSAFQLWQWERVEARLIALEGGGGPAAPTPVARPQVHGACEDADWWKSDVAATAEPGNLLKMHRSCRVTAPTVVRGGTLRRVWGSDPNGLNIYGNGGQSADVREIYRYVSGYLAQRIPEDPLSFEPELAQKVTVSEDGLVYTITLRKGVYWHTPQVDWASGRYEWLRGDHLLTADDYVFVFESILDKRMAARFASARSGFTTLKKVEAVDAQTFTLTFSEWRHSLLSDILLTEPLPRWLYAHDEDGNLYDAASFPDKFLTHWYSQRAIGVGPYEFAEWKQGEGIKLRRFERYWGEPGAFDKVDLNIIQDKAGWPRALQNQALDMVTLMPTQYRTTILEAPGGKPFGNEHVKSAVNDQFSYFYVGWNRTNPRFADKRVRQALTMALDRQGLLDGVYAGLGRTLTGPLVPGHPCYDDSVPARPYDPVAAGALLDEAGWKDSDGDGVRDKLIGQERVDLDFRLLLFGASDEWRTIGNQILESYRKIGVKVALDPEEWATQQQRMKKRDFDAVTGSWSLDYEFDPRGLWHSSGADVPESSNYISFREPELDKLIESFESDRDETHRLETCKAIHAWLHEDQPYTELFSRTTPVLWWDWMNDLRLFPVNPARDLRYYSFATARP